MFLQKTKLRLFLYQNPHNQLLTNMKDVKNIKELLAIGRKIKSFRTLKGFTQEDLATELVISKTALQDIENGKTDLNFTRLQQIAEKLDTTLIELIGIGEGDFIYFHKNKEVKQAKVMWNNNDENSEHKVVLLEQKIGFLEEKNTFLEREIGNLKQIIALMESTKTT